jgi:hypothetical protein
VRKGGRKCKWYIVHDGGCGKVGIVKGRSVKEGREKKERGGWMISLLAGVERA